MCFSEHRDFTRVYQSRGSDVIFGDPNDMERAEPRAMVEILEDLRGLVQSDGALHSLSSLFYRDWVLKVDVLEGRVVDEEEERWSTNKLNNNEIMLLLGLMVQAQSDRTYSILPEDDSFMDRADKLLREFHDRLNENARLEIDWSKPEALSAKSALGPISQEAIYYGADGFYAHQFNNLSRLRYKNDGELYT